MKKEKICVGAALCGCVLLAVSAVCLSVAVFVVGFTLMMGGFAALA